MSHTLKSLLKVSVAAASLTVLAGCANHQHQDMQSQIDEAMEMASNAQSTADSANAKAELAQENANKALGDASDAQKTADSAMAKAEQNSEKIDRMFKQSMQK